MQGNIILLDTLLYIQKVTLQQNIKPVYILHTLGNHRPTQSTLNHPFSTKSKHSLLLHIHIVGIDYIHYYVNHYNQLPPLVSVLTHCYHYN